MARKRRRSPAQRAATRRLVAMNRRRRRNPNNRRNTYNRRPRRAKVMRTYVANPRRRRRSYRRRNPAARRMTFQSVVNQNLMPAFQGGAGALALDIAWGYLPIPANMKVGPMRHFIKGAGALALGMIAGTTRLARPATIHNMTTGALTVIMHTAMRETVAQFAPNVPLGEYMEGMGYYNAGQVTSPQFGQVPYGTPLTPMGEYMTDNGNMSAYETGIEGDFMNDAQMGVYE